jgi:hypothetical protein
MPMKNRRRVLGLCAAAMCLSAAAGCANHYRITDPGSGKVYYTRKVHRRLGGQILFKDALTGARVRLESSEVQKVPEGEYHSGLLEKQQPVAKE